MTKDIIFRKALTADLPEIWEILQQAIQRRKKDGSNQWQDGYPNPEVIQNDLDKGHGFVLIDRNTIIGYTAILINDEPEYEKLKVNGLPMRTLSFFIVSLYRKISLEKDMQKK